jgi:hypothetical protein
MIYVIGDSHTRAFSFNANFFPLFIGAGKQNNFVDEANSKTLAENVTNVLCRMEDLKYVMFVLGEPDARFFSGQGWYPWEAKNPPDISGYQEKCHRSIIRYERMLIELLAKKDFIPIVFNVTPSKRELQNVVVDYYNSCLKEMCENNNFYFVAINEKIYSKDENIIHEMYFGDTVHMNNQIQPLAEAELIKLKVIEKSGFNNSFTWDHIAVMKKFVFDPQFGCFKLSK